MQAKCSPDVGTWVDALMVTLLLFYALLEDNIRSVMAPWEEAPLNNVFLLFSMLLVEIRFSWEKFVTRGKL